MEKEEKRAKVVAITGGICTGKSFVLEELKKKNYPVFSCDDEIRDIRESNQEIKKQILEEFPEEKGDSKKIQNTIFNSEAKKKKLESILYPALEERRQKFLHQNKGKIVFIEVPLLYENGKEKQYDKVVVVSCSPETQKQRAIKRGINIVVLEKIMNSQLSTEEKATKADYLINTELDFEKTKRDIDFVCKELGEK